MNRWNSCSLPILLFIVLLAIGCSGNDRNSIAGGLPGSERSPLTVMLVPTDGGTEEGTKADFEPIFRAVAESTDLHFTIRVGQSYSAVVEAMRGGRVEIAFFGPVTYQQARINGAAELLAVAETNGSSSYYAGIFCRKESGWADLQDVKGKRIAFGDINSTSSFHYPIVMLLDANIDPVRDLASVYITGSHANALQALVAGKVDAACSSLESYTKAVQSGRIDSEKIHLIAKSEAIPYPPLAVHPALPERIKSQLREAFHQVHEREDLEPEMIRGYGGLRVDRYNAYYPQAKYDAALAKLSEVTHELKEKILRKAS